MLFINPKNDTLKLIKPEETLMVTIATDTFSFFKNTFVKKITHYNNAINLFQKIDLKHIDNEKKQAYGYSSVTGDQSSTTFTNGMGTTTYLEVDQNLVYVSSGDLFISNDKGDFFPVKSASFNKIYPQYKGQIASFSKTNKTDWDELKDVTKVMEFLQQLSKSESKTP